MKKFVLIFVTAVAVASVSVFAAYNLPETPMHLNTKTRILWRQLLLTKSLQSLLHRRMLI